MKQQKVTASFVACGRCSFFLTSYRMIHHDYEAAVDESSGGWLNLSWNQKIGNLILKSYGAQIDGDIYYFEGICPECKRRFIYSSASEATEVDVADNASESAVVAEDTAIEDILDEEPKEEDAATKDAAAEEVAAEEAADDEAGSEAVVAEDSVTEETRGEITEVGKGKGGKPILQVEVSPGTAT